MSGLRTWLNRYTVATVILVLFVGFGAVQAADDEFSVDIDSAGDVVAGGGSGYGSGSWYYYSHTDWWNQWFYSGPYAADSSMVVEVQLTIDVLDPVASKASSVQIALNWTAAKWASDSVPPLPSAIDSLQEEESLIERRIVVPTTEFTNTISVTTEYEIDLFCPEWVSIDIRGENVHVEGTIQYERQADLDPPQGERDFGDAPEGALAYPSTGVLGRFPTCVSTGSASWIEHQTKDMYFGDSADTESEGNGGVGPVFNPDSYNQDEGMKDGDAGLIRPRAYTIAGDVGSEDVYALIFTSLQSMGGAGDICIWGSSLDIEVHNNSASGQDAYVNVLFDWDQNGQWKGSAMLGTEEIPEHVLVNFPVPAGYHGDLSDLDPDNFDIGPYVGYIWVRFTITDSPVPEEGWTGDGAFADGETEDYLVYVRGQVEYCDWNQGDPHSMHKPQLPDHEISGTGVGIEASETILADDYQCSETSMLKSLHFWGAFADDARPPRGSNSMTFQVTVYEDLPADGLVPYNRPGDVLWTTEVARFGYDTSQIYSVEQDFYDPNLALYEPDDHRRIYQFNICFEDEELFVQQSGTTYWIGIEKLPDDFDADYTFEWLSTTKKLQWNANSVYLDSKLEWAPIAYPTGHSYEGEPLDLSFVIVGQADRDRDYGDAPDPMYPTLAAHNGASHVVDDALYLGRSVDAEPDGQPTPSSAGDDNNGDDDDDGVTFTSAVVAGDVATVDVEASAYGLLSAWVDFNADGDWDDEGEQIFADVELSIGVNSLGFDVPAKAVSGMTFSRWRFSTRHGLSYTGSAPNGEVEDQIVNIKEGLDKDFF